MLDQHQLTVSKDPTLFAVWDIISTAWGSADQHQDPTVTAELDGDNSASAPLLALEDGTPYDDDDGESCTTTQPEQTAEDDEAPPASSTFMVDDDDVEGTPEVPVVVDSQVMEEYMNDTPWDALDPWPGTNSNGESQPPMESQDVMTLEPSDLPAKSDSAEPEPEAVPASAAEAGLPDTNIKDSMPPPAPLSPGKIQRRKEIAARLAELRLGEPLIHVENQKIAIVHP